MNKDIDLKRGAELVSSDYTITDAAKKCCEEAEITYTDSKRRKLSRFLNSPQELKRQRGEQLETEEVVNEFENALEKGGFKGGSWGNGWYKPDKHLSIHIKNTKHEVPFEVLKHDLVESLKEFSPEFERVVADRDDTQDPHALVIDIADLHIGKLGIPNGKGEESYNVDIACQRAKESVEGLLCKAQGFSIEKVVFIVGNDVLHTDNANKTTTKGTPQEVSGTWYNNFVRARKLYTSLLEYITNRIGDVHVVHCPSNHDYVTGFMLADSVYSWFRKHPNITWDISNRQRKYYLYGRNLLGFAHGDGCSYDKLALLMPTEAKRLWAQSNGGTWLLHHIHHKQLYKWKGNQDMINGVSVEYMRSPSGADEWHDKRGYAHSPQAVEGKVFHKTYGQVSHLVHRFNV